MADSPCSVPYSAHSRKYDTDVTIVLKCFKFPVINNYKPNLSFIVYDLLDAFSFISLALIPPHYFKPYKALYNKFVLYFILEMYFA